MSLALCLVSGTVFKPDGSPFASGQVTFASIVPQTVQGSVVPSTTVVANTDVNGNLNGGAGVNLIQGLQIIITLTLNGNQNGQISALVPITSTTTFGGLFSGLLPASPNAMTTGTWLPIVRGDGSAGSVTYNTQNGHYIQIAVSGGQTWNWLYYNVSTASFSGATGGLDIAGLPFANISTSLAFSISPIAEWSGFTLAAGYTTIGSQLAPGSSTIAVIKNGSGVAAAAVAITETSSTIQMYGSIYYRSV